MKYLVKQLIRAADIVNIHGLVLQKWSPRKVMDLYMGVRNFFAFTSLSSDKMRRYEKTSQKTYFNALTNVRGKYLGRSDGMSGAGGISLVFVKKVLYFNNRKCKYMYLLSFFQNN